MTSRQKTRGEAVFDRERFGAFLKASRRAQGLSQPELADGAGISKQVVSNLETGRVTPTVDTICQLANALGLPPMEMLKAGLRGRSGGRKSEFDRVLEIFSGFNAEETGEAIAILESIDRLRLSRAS
jgi:transcriptional regulator with XRE-family HTH domain